MIKENNDLFKNLVKDNNEEGALSPSANIRQNLLFQRANSGNLCKEA